MKLQLYFFRKRFCDFCKGLHNLTETCQFVRLAIKSAEQSMSPNFKTPQTTPQTFTEDMLKQRVTTRRSNQGLLSCRQSAEGFIFITKTGSVFGWKKEGENQFTFFAGVTEEHLQAGNGKLAKDLFRDGWSEYNNCDPLPHPGQEVE